MVHKFASTFFIIIIISLLLNKTKLRDKINLIKVHKILGSLLVIYMILYTIIDFTFDQDAFILLLIPSLVGIYYTGKNKATIQFKYAHTICIVVFLITLLSHIFI